MSYNSYRYFVKYHLVWCRKQSRIFMAQTGTEKILLNICSKYRYEILPLK